MDEGVEKATGAEKGDCASCAGGFPKGEPAAGIENRLEDGLGGVELDDGSGLETAGTSFFSFCILKYVDLYDSRNPDMSAKGSSSIPFEIALRRE